MQKIYNSLWKQMVSIMLVCSSVTAMKPDILEFYNYSGRQVELLVWTKEVKLKIFWEGPKNKIFRVRISPTKNHKPYIYSTTAQIERIELTRTRAGNEVAFEVLLHRAENNKRVITKDRSRQNRGSINWIAHRDETFITIQWPQMRIPSTLKSKYIRQREEYPEHEDMPPPRDLPDIPYE